MKLCGTIAGRSIKECMAIATRDDVDLVEHRLDALESTEALADFYSSLDVPIIATNRKNDEVTEEERVMLLKEAIDLGATYVDIEVDAKMKEELIEYAKKKKCSIIYSFHDFSKTASLDDLKAQYKSMKSRADIVKIVTTAKTTKEGHRLLELMMYAKTPIIAFAMGESGTFTRPLSLLYGAPFTYVCLGKPTAPGQLSSKQMKDILKVLA